MSGKVWVVMQTVAMECSLKVPKSVPSSHHYIKNPERIVIMIRTWCLLQLPMADRLHLQLDMRA